MPWNLLFSALLLVFLVVIDLYTFKYPAEARLFPWVVGLPATVLMFIHTIKEISRLRQGTEEHEDGSQAVGDKRAYVLIIAWMVGFLIMIYILGFLAAIPLFIFLYLKTHGLSWFRSLGLAAGLIIVIYLIFSLGMEMRLHPGIIFS